MPQPQGGANLYQVTGEKARNARAATTDAEQAQFQARYAKTYYAWVKVINLYVTYTIPEEIQRAAAAPYPAMAGPPRRMRSPPPPRRGRRSSQRRRRDRNLKRNRSGDSLESDTVLKIMGAPEIVGCLPTERK